MRPYDLLPQFGQELACTLAGYQRSRRRYTRHFFHTLDAWESSARSPEEELRSLQALRLAAVLDHSRANVPYYRDLPPIRRLSDPGAAISETLAQVPPLEKQTYRDRASEFVATNIPKHRLFRGHTSGTTGTALLLWYSPETMAEEYATVWRMRRLAGVDRLDPHLTFGGQVVVPFEQSKPPFWRRDFYARQTLFSLYHMKPDNLPAYVDAMHDAKARYVQGYPSALHVVAQALLDAGRPFPEGEFAGVFTSSESLREPQRKNIEQAFGTKLRDRYGASEFAVSMTSCDQSNLHVDHEYCVVEVEPQEETDEWVRGPLLVTGLGNHVTPFIRYRIGDIGTRLKAPCPCGRPGDAFVSIDGRIEDYVATPDGRLIGRLDHIFKDQHLVAEAQIRQDSRESIEILVVPRRGFGPNSENALRREVRARLGTEIGIEITLTDTIPRETNGKLRAVRSSMRESRD